MSRPARLLSTGLTLVLCAGGAAPASAQTRSYIDWNYINGRTAQNQAWWNSLTPRQRELSQRVYALEDQHSAATGEAFIQVTPQNLATMIRLVGATPAEGGFVRERMESNAQFRSADRQVSRSLDHMRQNPQWYLPPHMRAQP